MIGNIVAGTLSAGVAPVFTSYESIATQIVGSGGATSISFTSIPSTYKHLQIRANVIMPSTWIQLNFNSDTSSSYITHELRGNGSSAASYNLGIYETNGIWVGLSNSASYPVGMIVDVLDYASTSKNKTVRSLYGTDNNGSGQLSLISGAYFKTDAVTSITISADNSSYPFSENAHFALYGIKD